MTVVWKPIPTYPDYEASDSGDIRSKDMKIEYKSTLGSRVTYLKTGRTLHKKKCKNGYLRVAPNSRTETVHSLVASAFLGERPYGFCINHKDGDKTNNNINNLEYCSYLHNNRHAIKTGLRKNGNNGKPILTSKEVLEIRFLKSKYGASCKSIAKLFNKSESSIERIVNGSGYKNINN